MLLLVESINLDIDVVEEKMSSWELIYESINNPTYLSLLFSFRSGFLGNKILNKVKLEDLQDKSFSI